MISLYLPFKRNFFNDKERINNRRIYGTHSFPKAFHDKSRSTKTSLFSNPLISFFQVSAVYKEFHDNPKRFTVFEQESNLCKVPAQDSSRLLSLIKRVPMLSLSHIASVIWSKPSLRMLQSERSNFLNVTFSEIPSRSFAAPFGPILHPDNNNVCIMLLF